MAFTDPRFLFWFQRIPLDPPASAVFSLGEQRRSGLVFGTTLASSFIVPMVDGVDAGVDPRYNICFSRLDLASEYMDRRKSFQANQEAQKFAAQTAAEKDAAAGDPSLPAASE